MTDYYHDNLAAERLRRCYHIAPPRVQQYLAAEVEFARSFIKPTHHVLELGCGYGRILACLTDVDCSLTGIDTSPASIALASKELGNRPGLDLRVMDATDMQFESDTFDLTLCLQNGISAFHVDPIRLITESVRVTKPHGTVLFSTYSPAFWEERLAWFERQAAEGLIGEIDFEATGDGTIVCRDGFTATTVTGKQFRDLAGELPVAPELREIDQSSLFCILTVR